MAAATRAALLAIVILATGGPAAFAGPPEAPRAYFDRSVVSGAAVPVDGVVREVLSFGYHVRLPPGQGNLYTIHTSGNPPVRRVTSARYWSGLSLPWLRTRLISGGADREEIRATHADAGSFEAGGHRRRPAPFDYGTEVAVARWTERGVPVIESIILTREVDPVMCHAGAILPPAPAPPLLEAPFVGEGGEATASDAAPADAEHPDSAAQ